MSSVDQINNSVLAELGTTPAEAEAGNRTALGQEDFLELLLTQLKNQDPLSPMESAEFMGQLAQFGAVSSIQAVERSVTELATSLQSTQALQATSLVGRSVMVPDGVAVLEPDSQIRGQVEVPAGAGPVTLNIVDGFGQSVRTMSLGSHAGGVVSFDWDGLRADGTAASPGRYQVQASALLDGHQRGLQVATTARVQSVSLGRPGEGITVNLVDASSRSLDQIIEIL